VITKKRAGTDEIPVAARHTMTLANQEFRKQRPHRPHAKNKNPYGVEAVHNSTEKLCQRSSPFTVLESDEEPSWL
jgi:hypothetical protein